MPDVWVKWAAEGVTNRSDGRVSEAVSYIIVSPVYSVSTVFAGFYKQHYKNFMKKNFIVLRS